MTNSRDTYADSNVHIILAPARDMPHHWINTLPDASLVLYWDQSHKKTCVAPHHVFLDDYCSLHMPILREEIATFFYEMGYVPVRRRCVHEHLQAGGTLSMWWCSLLFEKHPQLTPFLADVLKLRALERILGNMSWTHMHVSGRAQQDHVKIIKILRQFCLSNHKNFSSFKDDVNSHTLPKSNLLRRIYTKIPHVAQCAIAFVHWLWTVRRLMPSVTCLHTKKKQSATMVAYFPHEHVPNSTHVTSFRSPYWSPLQDMLKEKRELALHWLFIRIRTEHTSLRQALSLCKVWQNAQKDGTSFYFAESFLNGRRIFLALVRYVRLAWASFRMEKDIVQHCCFAKTAQSINIWPLLHDAWRASFQGWRCLERCLQGQALEGYASHTSHMSQNTPHKWALFPWENCPWERLLVSAMRQYLPQSPVYGVQHSTIRPTDFRYFDDPRFFSSKCMPDLIITNGQHAYTQLRVAGMPEERMYMAEALRYTHLATLPRFNIEHKAKKFQLLVLTGFFASEVDAHMHTLEIFAQLAPKHIHICIKGHPYCPPHISRYPHLAARAMVIEATLSQVWADITAQKDVLTLVWTSNSTTAAVEAAIVGCPFVVQTPTHSLDLCPLQGVLNVPYVQSAEEVLETFLQPAPTPLPKDFFCLPPQSRELERWSRLLSTQ